MDNYDVITTDSKEKRDDIFRQMRESTDPLERASVKFSGNEPVLDKDGEPKVRTIAYSGPMKRGGRNKMQVNVGNLEFTVNIGRPQLRLTYISNWSVATPRPL